MMLDNLKKYKVILASNSPRRKELLAGLGVEYHHLHTIFAGSGYSSLHIQGKGGCLP